MKRDVEEVDVARHISFIGPLTFIFALSACGENPSTNSTRAGTDTVTEVDTDTSTDSEIETDSADTNTDTGADSDTDTDTESGSDEDTDTNIVDSETDTLSTACEKTCVRYVDQRGVGTRDGMTWQSAFSDVQDAIDSAYKWATDCGVECELWVVGGSDIVYRPSVTLDRNATFALRPGVALYGGFSGSETTKAERDMEEYPTVLSGDLLNNDESDEANKFDDNVYHVVTGSDDSVIDGFVIRGGHADSESHYADGKGGGMFNEEASPTVRNCRFAGNTALDGGGMYNGWRTSPTIINCTFEDNWAIADSGGYSGWGGGMYNDTGVSLVVDGCVFERNHAIHWGGGLFIWTASVEIENSRFTDNSSGEHGGGIFAWGAKLTINNSAFNNNTATGKGGGIDSFNRCFSTLADCTFSNNSAKWGGGAISNSLESSLNASGCSFSGNSTEWGGGAIDNAESQLAINSCDFFNNSAEDFGGGIHNSLDSSLNVTSSTFHENSAYWGGGISNSSSTCKIVNSTFFKNTGIGNEDSPHTGLAISNSGELSVTNSILWGDGDDLLGVQVQHWQSYGQPAPAPTITYSDIQHGCTTEIVEQTEGNGDNYPCTSDATGNIDADPMFIDPSNGDFSLNLGSPCIDAANGDIAPELDVEGNPRNDDPDSPNTGIGPPWADMGAFEFLQE